jgi:hypothetical protein
MPALLTITSARPNSSITWSRSCVRSFSFVTSHRIGSAMRPVAPISFANSSRRSVRRADTTTSAPASAIANAVARPIPAEAPVTTAIAPSKSTLTLPSGW